MPARKGFVALSAHKKNASKDLALSGINVIRARHNGS